ncbi:MAG: hypothetical protein J3K34DRAFT_15237 [Monoraphidium minutum]|nr:MAG: hypothetical protein J3K34DRAFT_15237 [Monoraphidium minutum]
MPPGAWEPRARAARQTNVCSSFGPAAAPLACARHWPAPDDPALCKVVQSCRVATLLSTMSLGNAPFKPLPHQTTVSHIPYLQGGWLPLSKPEAAAHNRPCSGPQSSNARHVKERSPRRRGVHAGGGTDRGRPEALACCGERRVGKLQGEGL